MRWILLLLLCNIGFAKYLRNNFESARATGMGNAFIALADDSSAPWYNPACLTEVKGGHFNFVNLGVTVDSLDSFTRLTGLLAGNTSNFLRTDTQMMHAPIQLGWISRYFTFQVYENFHSYTDLGNLSIANMDIALFSDTGAMVGLALPVSEYFSIGASARTFVRAGVDMFITPAQLLAQIGIPAGTFQTAVYNYMLSQFGTGWGTGFNVGALLKIPLSSGGRQRLRLAASIEDLGNTQFVMLSSRKPNPVLQVVNFGGALQYLINKNSQLNITADFRHAYDAPHLAKMFHLGAEYRHKFFSIRAGAHHLYPTFGISIEAHPHTKIHVSTYGVELGEVPYEKYQRWYMAQVVIGFNPI